MTQKTDWGSWSIYQKSNLYLVIKIERLYFLNVFHVYFMAFSKCKTFIEKAYGTGANFTITLRKTDMVFKHRV